MTKNELVTILACVLDDDELNSIEIKNDIVSTFVSTLRAIIEAFETNVTALNTRYYMRYVSRYSSIYRAAHSMLDNMCRIFYRYVK